MGSAPGKPPQLCCLTGRRWLKPLSLPDVAAVTNLARIADSKWLVVGRARDGTPLGLGEGRRVTREPAHGGDRADPDDVGHDMDGDEQEKHERREAP